MAPSPTPYTVINGRPRLVAPALKENKAKSDADKGHDSATDIAGPGQARPTVPGRTKAARTPLPSGPSRRPSSGPISAPAHRSVGSLPAAPSMAMVPIPSPVTLDDILRLGLEVRSLLSDLFVLQGTFLPQNREKDPENVEEFKKNGFATSSQFYKYEERIAKFRNEVEKRIEEQATELPGSNRDWSDAVAAEYLALAKLCKDYDRCKSRLTSLRELLETRHANESGVYEYEVAVIYQQIGNQVKPPGYKKPKTNSAASRSMTSSPALGTPSKPSNAKKRTVASGLRNETEQNGRPAKRVKFASAGAQLGEDSALAPASARIGAVMRVQIRTEENVDQDIAWRIEQIALSKERIEKLNAEILELRWEKKVMTEGRGA
ncbi:hypothetical protein BKA61DRAFT_680324 [Leptodontidium sp. MPI-SDFR-AT-0119]|nr:hypothetical protein BKA61DRAFT_680324 [Leptodontidium sp. MPI-SDFR-AT-0119]